MNSVSETFDTSSRDRSTRSGGRSGRRSRGESRVERSRRRRRGSKVGNARKSGTRRRIGYVAEGRSSRGERDDVANVRESSRSVRTRRTGDRSETRSFVTSEDRGGKGRKCWSFRRGAGRSDWGRVSLAHQECRCSLSHLCVDLHRLVFLLHWCCSLQPCDVLVLGLSVIVRDCRSGGGLRKAKIRLILSRERRVGERSRVVRVL